VLREEQKTTMRGKNGIRAYEYRHVVGFEETNLVGNVYYVNHLRWQGRCRELFLRDHAPEVLAALEDDLALVTVSVHCDYLAELRAFDEVVVCMHLAGLAQNRMTLGFAYRRLDAEAETLIARGEQVVACMRREGERLVPTPIPETLREALRLYDPVMAVPGGVQLDPWHRGPENIADSSDPYGTRQQLNLGLIRNLDDYLYNAQTKVCGYLKIQDVAASFSLRFSTTD